MCSRKQDQPLLKSSASKATYSPVIDFYFLCQIHTHFQFCHPWMQNKAQQSLRPLFWVIWCVPLVIVAPEWAVLWGEVPTKPGFIRIYVQCTLHPSFQILPTTATPAFYHETPGSASALTSPFILCGLWWIQFLPTHSHTSYQSLLLHQDTLNAVPSLKAHACRLLIESLTEKLGEDWVKPVFS